MHTESFMSAKFDNEKSPFFVDKPDQIIFLFQNLLGCIHYCCSPRFNWTNSWLDWKTFFVKLHTETFMGAKFDNDISTFFVDYTDKKIPFVSKPTRIHTLLLYPSFNLNKSLTRMKNTFRETAYRHFFERKVWQRNEYFFRGQTRWKILFVSKLTRMHTFLL